ncbi:MAG: rhodanese-like domain-containing protein [Gammaproteobacteria bacterium]|nr:rhodanese-like domain-containing protein [Gammaproteobacteria bacterium]
MINLNPIYINIAGYRFTPIEDIDDTLIQLKSLCANLDIKGSIYLASEGINIGVSGNILEIQTFRSQLNKDARFSNMRFHELYSLYHPYKKITVKTKTELVPIEDNTLKVGDFDHQYLPPLELKEWLDSGKDFILLDMRNEFEFELGTFDKAKQLNLRRFRKLQTKADEISKLPTDKPIVTFCTGGIRCEKAAPYLEKFGFDKVYQLEGGIIEYLRQTKGAHWHGNCFVFDDRVSINSDLAPEHFNLCTDCQLILKDSEVEFCTSCLSNHISQDVVI